MRPRTQGGQPSVAGPNLVTAMLFQMIEEGQNPFGRGDGQRGLIRLDPILLLKEAPLQAKGAPVSRTPAQPQDALCLRKQPLTLSGIPPQSANGRWNVREPSGLYDTCSHGRTGRLGSSPPR